MYLHLFKAHLFFHLWVFALLLSKSSPLFSMPEKIVLCKVLAKLGCCRALYSFLRG
jgi:hypothetical protein